jgi:hypothetical protein
MANVQGSSGAGDGDIPPRWLPRAAKGKAVAQQPQKKKKKKLPRGHPDDWDTTLAAAAAEGRVECGGVAAAFPIRDWTGSPVAPEGATSSTAEALLASSLSAGRHTDSSSCDCS